MWLTWLKQPSTHKYVSISKWTNLSDVFLNAIIHSTFSVPESDLMDITFSDPEFDRMEITHFGASDSKGT
jgi:hypothetical protein